MDKIKKAVIPAAGLGTRTFPASKAVPKEMLPIVDKPAVQYIVEEAVRSGINDILIIVNSENSITEKHFSRLPELEKKLKEGGGKEKYLQEIIGISNLANISFVIQKEQKGLGHAVLQAKEFAGGCAFAVMYGDDVIIGDDPCISQLCRAYEKYGKSVAGIKEVPEDSIQKYSSLKVSRMEENIYNVTDMIEKPSKGMEFSLFSILGRCILTPEIFDILEKTPYGFGNELQLTDAMKILAQEGKMTGVDFTGKRYDIGDKFGMLQASVELGLAHDEIGAKFKEYLLDLIKTI